MTTELIFGIIGGLGLFLYGMQLLSDGLQKVTGDRIQKVMEFLTNKPIMGVATGALITSIIQSSSATSVITIGLVNAGLLSLKQAVSVIVGANIGTTVTAQIVSFRLEKYALPAIGIGFIVNFLAKKRSYKYFGQILLGFGILFLGLYTMSQALKPLRNYTPFLNLLTNISHNPLLGIVVAAIFTAIIQSSSATTAIIIAMSIQGIMGIEAAIPLVLGSNIGTCFTAVIASIGSSITGKRVAISHLFFNIGGVVLFFFFLSKFSYLVSLTSSSIPRQIANAHTLFNLINAVILLPFLSLFIKLVVKVLPGEEIVIKKGPIYLNKDMLNTPSIALSQATKELVRMGEMVESMLNDVMMSFIQNDLNVLKSVYLKEEVVNTLEKEITKYLVLISQSSLSPEQSKRLTDLLNIVNDIERVGDHAENLAELAEEKINEKLPFSEKALSELKFMFSKVQFSLNKSISALRNRDIALAREVALKEDEIDKIEKELRANHIKRLNQGICYPESGVIFLDVISNLERVGDHANNISLMVIDELSND
ncbi:sodium:solute symporter [Candidatus Atribacteria bacterium RBG_19FT_COMBO_35_14]|uniref:Sodium:solute symporter n=1 Tax=Candidatus Sediminicultor quintus TaxID=1797291 RepID=A0A1F5AER6_9BACT|nr:MAG: sodium:solute symporter [Candidatus Atribacteria bacterium RBG_19FT_COMBO_35_14]OGD34846.1 MAG: sodium:solute symporter [Candidatus Atribacteria bacterium RBG_16_35_8]